MTDRPLTAAEATAMFAAIDSAALAREEQQLNTERIDRDDRSEPCGESGCLCYGVGEEHADCACGCDCPRCWDCMQGTDNCTCDD